MYEINDLGDLMRAIQDSLTGGYIVDTEIKPNMEKSRYGDGFFLVIDVSASEPDSYLSGEYWFDADDNVMQVL